MTENLPQPENQQPPAPATPRPPAEGELPHKPADDREEVYYEGSPMLRAELGRLSGYALAALVLLAIPFIIHFAFRAHVPWWGYLAGFVVAAFVFCLPILLIRTIRYRITNYRIDYERGLLSKHIDTLELWHVEDISFEQSLPDRMLSVGTITIVSHDETTPRLVMHGIPNPRPVFESLKQRVIAVKRQRGVIKMDIG